MNWCFPLLDWSYEIPSDKHPGAFGVKRKHDVHTGVDLYVPDEDIVLAVEGGFVVAIEDYTGPSAESPWWLPTNAILIEGPSGVVCYGEIKPMGVGVGDMILKEQVIGHVVPVLKEGKARKDIPGHSRFMLHMELYKPGTRETVWWKLNDKKPKTLLDPTFQLQHAERK